MTDVAMDFIKKVLGKRAKKVVEAKAAKVGEAQVKHVAQLQTHLDLKERVVENKIRLRTLESITEEKLDEAFSSSDMDKYITSLIQVQIAEEVRTQAHYIVSEALRDLEDNISVKQSIRSSVIQQIRDAVE